MRPGPCLLPLLAMSGAGLMAIPAEQVIAVLPQPGFVTILMHHRGAAGRPVVWLRIPDQYVRGRSDVVIDRYGLFLFATYPDLKGAFSPENRGLLVCRGYCRGRMMIGLENRSGDAFPVDAMAAGLRRTYGTGPSSAADGYGVFDTAESDLVSRGPLTQRVNYYAKTDKAGRMTAFVVCHPSGASPTCQERMALAAHPDVWVTYTFSMRHLSQWPAVRTAVTGLADSFIVRTLPAETGRRPPAPPPGGRTVAWTAPQPLWSE